MHRSRQQCLVGVVLQIWLWLWLGQGPGNGIFLFFFCFFILFFFVCFFLFFFLSMLKCDNFVLLSWHGVDVVKNYDVKMM